MDESNNQDPKDIQDQDQNNQQQKNEPKIEGEAEQNQGQQKNNQDKLKASKISVGKKEKEQLWKPYDFLFPGGKLAKLIKVHNAYKKNLPIRDMLDKFKFNERFPVVNLIGAMEKGRGKFYAGIVRAAFNTDAIIVDNGLSSGIQKFALRRGVKFIGIAPESEIKFPKINPTQVDPL